MGVVISRNFREISLIKPLAKAVVSCPSIQDVHPVVKQTGLGSLCLSERGRHPKNVCGGGVAG